MDSFEPIRAAAAHLHQRLVDAGANPEKPIVLAKLAAHHLDLEVAWLQPGDPALKGAKALFDEQSGTILCDVSGTPIEKALLVAHEVGHAAVHSGSSACAANDMDASRSSEAAPVGLQRVEDYGVRERRELQANVYARELLFPRELAKRLHGGDTLTASAIAERTGLPLPLVRQQILDAMLLPRTEKLPEKNGTQPTLEDKAQDRAAEHRGSPFQLQAGPGTGKTRTLIKRIISLVDEGIDPASILVLTFSNRAAGELAERVAAALPEAAGKIWIGTFHSFGLDIVRRYHDRLKLPSDPSLFDKSDAIAVLEEILPTLPLVHYRNLWDPAMVLREILSGISRAKDELVDEVAYRALAEKMRKEAVGDEKRTEAAEKCLEVAEIYDHYEAAKRERGAVDFGDLIMLPAVLLKADPELATAVQLRHRHVLVDEYQDVNRASVQLVKSLAGNGKRLWVVGDARQSIYRFRGASSSNMSAYADDFPGATIDKLEISYRSTQNVIDTFCAFAPHMGASTGMLPLNLTANRGKGADVAKLSRFDSLESEAEGVAAGIRDLESSGVKLRDQAVLCRTNNKLTNIAAALEARGIPVLHLGSLFEREEIRDLLSLLSLAIDPFADGLVRVGAMPRYNIPLQDVRLVTQWLRESDEPPLAGLMKASGAPGISPQAAAGIAKLSKDLAGLRRESMAWDFLTTYLLDRTPIVREMADTLSVAGQVKAVALWQFMNFVRQQSPVGSGFPIYRTLDRVRQLVLLAEERDLRQIPACALHLNAVRLMTVHASKGLEFEAVHIPGVTEVSFPTQYRGSRCPPPEGMIDVEGSLSVTEEAKQSHKHEEECLFFVAMSRSRTQLRMYLSRFQENGKKRTASKFLDKIPARLLCEISDPATLPLPPGAGRAAPIAITWPNGREIGDSRLSLYQRCPRRFFYTHILGLGGAKKPTAFTRTHDCLYQLIDWLSEARVTGDAGLEVAEKAFDDIWNAKGPIELACASDYRRLANRLVAALVNSGAGRKFREAVPLAIDFPNGKIIIQPDELAELPNGTVVLRRVHTGYRRDKEYDRIEYTLYKLAGRKHFNGNFIIEAIHLTDEVIEEVDITDEKFSNRVDKTQSMLKSIAAGEFPTAPDAVTCARCPHFFVCAATPDGSLIVD